MLRRYRHVAIQVCLTVKRVMKSADEKNPNRRSEFGNIVTAIWQQDATVSQSDPFAAVNWT